MSKNAKELLQTELVQAKEQLANLDRQLQHRPDFGLGEGSPEIITWEMNLARRNVLTQRIEEIEQALEETLPATTAFVSIVEPRSIPSDCGFFLTHDDASDVLIFQWDLSHQRMLKKKRWNKG